MIVIGVLASVNIILHRSNQVNHLTVPESPRFERPADEEIERLYRQGMDLNRTQGPREALEFFEKAFERTGALEMMYGIAWFESVFGNYDRASNLCKYILAHEPKILLMARCYYSLGYIASENENFESSIDFFSQSLQIYTGLNSPENQFKCYLGLALSAINAGFSDEADKHLNLALNLSSHHQVGHDELAYLYHLKTRSAFNAGNYLGGVNFSKQCLDGYLLLGENFNSALAYLDYAYFLGLTGDIVACQEFTDRGEGILSRHGEVFSVRVLTNRVLVNRCQGKDSEMISKKALDILADNPTLYYEKKLLEFTLTYECQN